MGRRPVGVKAGLLRVDAKADKVADVRAVKVAHPVVRGA